LPEQVAPPSNVTETDIYFSLSPELLSVIPAVPDIRGFHRNPFHSLNSYEGGCGCVIERAGGAALSISKILAFGSFRDVHVIGPRVR
jgi:hypothetical protein